MDRERDSERMQQRVCVVKTKRTEQLVLHGCSVRMFSMLLPCEDAVGVANEEQTFLDQMKAATVQRSCLVPYTVGL